MYETKVNFCFLGYFTFGDEIMHEGEAICEFYPRLKYLATVGNRKPSLKGPADPILQSDYDALKNIRSCTLRGEKIKKAGNIGA